jgi:hypothetical protein
MGEPSVIQTGRGRFRKLRIVYSVVWGIGSVLLCMLWVRSYWRYDSVSRFDANQVRTSVDSGGARITMAKIDYGQISRVPMVTHGWRWEGNQPIMEDSGAMTGPSFQWSRERVGSAIIFPHWCPALVFAGLAAVVWIPWSSRFSLRTLLIVATVVAAVLGLVVFRLRN